MKTKAIILLSGGLDSGVILAQAIEQGRKCLAVSFDYGQRHRKELDFARDIASYYQVRHRIIAFSCEPFTLSGLCSDQALPEHRSQQQIAVEGIPNSYVPARNTLFFAYALAIAEQEDAQEIYYGANCLDWAAYPDCTPEYVSALQKVAQHATKQAAEGSPPRIVAPLLFLNKQAILKEALRLGVPLEKTWSCYQPLADGRACGKCDACQLRPGE